MTGWKCNPNTIKCKRCGSKTEWWASSLHKERKYLLCSNNDKCRSGILYTREVIFQPGMVVVE